METVPLVMHLVTSGGGGTGIKMLVFWLLLLLSDPRVMSSTSVLDTVANLLVYKWGEILDPSQLLTVYAFSFLKKQEFLIFMKYNLLTFFFYGK